LPRQVCLLLNMPAFPGHTTVREPLDSHGSCHPLKAAAFRRNQRAPPVSRWPVDPVAGDPLPSLHGHYPTSSLLRRSPPLGRASVLSTSCFCHLGLFPWHRRPGSHVPYESLDWSHAPCTPDTTWTVNRSLPCLSQSFGSALVLMSPNF